MSLNHSNSKSHSTLAIKTSTSSGQKEIEKTSKIGVAKKVASS
jgi:hypothetical protein